MGSPSVFYAQQLHRLEEALASDYARDKRERDLTDSELLTIEAAASTMLVDLWSTHVKRLIRQLRRVERKLGVIRETLR